MIKLEFEIAIFLYLLIAIFGILIVWMANSGLRIPSKERTSLESIWQCSVCTYVYIDSKHKTLSACPRCNSYNERKGGAP